MASQEVHTPLFKIFSLELEILATLVQLLYADQLCVDNVPHLMNAAG